MSDMYWFVLISTVAAALAIAVGIIFPAIAMGRAITQALDSLARQPEAAGMVRTTMFLGIAFVEALALIGFVVFFLAGA